MQPLQVLVLPLLVATRLGVCTPGALLPAVPCPGNKMPLTQDGTRCRGGVGGLVPKSTSSSSALGAFRLSLSSFFPTEGGSSISMFSGSSWSSAWASASGRLEGWRAERVPISMLTTWLTCPGPTWGWLWCRLASWMLSRGVLGTRALGRVRLQPGLPSLAEFLVPGSVPP